MSRKHPSAVTRGTPIVATTRYRAAEPLPAIVRAVLDARDEAAVIFGAGGDVLYVNRAAQATLPPATMMPGIESGLVRALLDARGGEVVPLQSDAQVLGEMVVLPHSNGGTWAQQEREAIRQALRQTGGRLAQAARRLGVSRTTLWRRLRSEQPAEGSTLPSGIEN